MNNKFFLRFTGSFTLYLLIILALSAYPLYAFAGRSLIIGSISNLILFYLITVASVYIVIRATKIKGATVNAFLAGTIIKILLALIYLLIFLKNYPGNEIEFAISFFATYLICTGFEVYWILYNLREI